MKTFLKFTAIGIFLAYGVAYFFVPPPQSALAQLSSGQTWAGTSGGTANAQTLTIHNVVALNDLLGVPIRFLPGNTNVNATPAAMTLTINIDTGGTLGPVTVNRKTSNLGLQALSGGEVQSGVMTEVVYDGTVFEISSPVDYTPVGKTIELRQSSLTAPLGSLIEDGSCYTRTAFPALFSAIGTTYNSGAPSACSGSQFAVPFSNGTGFAALDNQGANTANKLTSAGSGCTATAVGTFCGSQNQSLTLGQLPVGIQAGGTNTINVTSNLANIIVGNLVGGINSTGGAILGLAAGASQNTPTASGNNSIAVTSTNTGGNAHPIVQPVLLGLRAIKY